MVINGCSRQVEFRNFQSKGVTIKEKQRADGTTYGEDIFVKGPRSKLTGLSCCLHRFIRYYKFILSQYMNLFLIGHHKSEKNEFIISGELEIAVFMKYWNMLTEERKVRYVQL